MRIGIDARFFGPKQKGLGRYVQKLIENLPNSDDFEFVIFLRKENFDDFEPPAKNFKKVLADWKWYTFAEQIFMPIKIWQEKIDLMHFPHFNVPIFCPTKFVVTIHDLVLKKFPTKRAPSAGSGQATTLNPLLYKIKEFGYKLVLSHAIKKSQKIIVPSNFTKNEILNYFKIKPEKIQVIYEGVPQQTTNSKQLTTNNKLFEKYGIKGPYILYVGNAYPHKNLEGLIRAFSRIYTNLGTNFRELQLVLVGEIDYFYKRLQQTTIQQYNNITINEQIVFTGFVPDDDLPELYKNAILYVSPAFFEGFGLPALEAMSYGAPVAASSGGAQPEISGEAALYFDPHDIDNMAEKITTLLKDEKLRKSLASKGREQVKKYSWQKMAEKTMEIYKEILHLE